LTKPVPGKEASGFHVLKAAYAEQTIIMVLALLNFLMKNFIKHHFLLANGIRWATFKAQIDLHSNEFQRLKLQAQEKAKYTMAASQSGAHRSFTAKYENQLRGCLAEAYSKLLIEEYAADAGKNIRVVRYDDVRTDGFKSATDEFDLKVIVEGNTKLLEARSSVVHDRRFEVGLENFDIIGPYVSKAKAAEKLNDYYIRPLYAYANYARGDFYQQKLEDLVRHGSVALHFVGGTDLEKLHISGYSKSMGQGATSYSVMPILQGYAVEDFLSKITS
jgi:hypothetical protein